MPSICCKYSLKQVFLTAAITGEYNYLNFISKHLQKNKVAIKKGIVDDKYPPLQTAVQFKRNLQWFKLFFDFCSKVDTAPKKQDFEEAIKHDNFSKMAEECQAMIQENCQKFYPNT